jgi:hypothetical protein
MAWVEGHATWRSPATQRSVLAIVLAAFTCAHHPQPTVAFRTQYQVHYTNIRETPPPGTKSNADSTGKAVLWWKTLPEEVRQQWVRCLGTRLW